MDYTSSLCGSSVHIYIHVYIHTYIHKYIHILQDTLKRQCDILRSQNVPQCEHFEVSRKQGIREEEEMGITHGNRLRTYKRECPRAFSQTLQVTLVMQAGLARTNMCSHAALLQLCCSSVAAISLSLFTNMCPHAALLQLSCSSVASLSLSLFTNMCSHAALLQLCCSSVAALSLSLYKHVFSCSSVAALLQLCCSSLSTNMCSHAAQLLALQWEGGGDEELRCWSISAA